MAGTKTNVNPSSPPTTMLTPIEQAAADFMSKIDFTNPDAVKKAFLEMARKTLITESQNTELRSEVTQLQKAPATPPPTTSAFTKATP